MSFRLKSVIGIAVIEIALLTILVFSGLHYVKTSNETQFQERAQTTARLLATMTTDAVVAFDLATLDALVEEAMMNRDIQYVRVRGRDGIVLSKGGDPEVLELLDNLTAPSTISDGRIDVTNQITIEGTPFGYVDIGLDTKYLETTLLDATHWMLSVAGIEILLVALFGYLLGSALTKQLTALQLGAKRVAEGQLGHQLIVKGSDELADTAQSFNKMSTSLAFLARDLETARKDAEARREIAESILHDAMSSLSEGVLITDAYGEVSHLNKAFKDLHLEQFEGKPIESLRTLDLILTPTIDRIVDGVASIDDLIDNKNDCRIVSPFGRFVGSDRGDQWTCKYLNQKTVLFTANKMANGGNVVMASDVSSIYMAEMNSRQLQSELMQSQKLEAIGKLAGGIAHELNTPMQFVGDNLSFINDASEDLNRIVEQHIRLLEKLKENGAPGDLSALAAVIEEADYEFIKEELPEAIKQSSDGVKQMANIVLAMKEFAHPTQKEKSDVDVNRALERASLVSRNEWKYIAEMDWQLCEPALLAQVNESELNQVILNIIVNAAHAVKAAGRPEGRIKLKTSKCDDKVTISIADNGIGIPAELHHRVYDQFFTTKDVGQGTGQGLALCHEFIVNRNHGKLYFETEDGIGTTFFIELPMAGALETAT
jgi:signal transduction histidine kinase